MAMDINEYFDLNDYYLKNLKTGGINDIQELCEQCSDYFLMDQNSRPSSDAGRRILESLPPQKGYSDKFVFGLYDGENILIGLIDIVKNYPSEGEWMLGFLLIHPQERNKGWGKLLHKGLINWIRSQKGDKLRIGVLKENQKAFKFWSSRGYKWIKETKLQRKGKQDKVISVMNYCL